jgi:hypothetical protein
MQSKNDSHSQQCKQKSKVLFKAEEKYRKAPTYMEGVSERQSS